LFLCFSKTVDVGAGFLVFQKLAIQMRASYWPVPLATHLFPDTANINPILVRVFRTMRATEALNNPDSQAVTQGFYTSD